MTVADCIKRLNYDCAWINADKYDRDERCFLESFICSVFHENRSGNTEELFDFLKKTEKSKFPKVIVVDNLHLCCSGIMARTLLILRMFMPEHTKLMLISRAPVPEPFLFMVLNNELSIFDVNDFTLTSDEFSWYLLTNGIKLSNKTLRYAYNNTGGWFAPLNYVLSAYSKAGTEVFSTCGKLFAQYINAEIFRHMAPVFHRFMFNTCLVDTFDESFCSYMNIPNSVIKQMLKIGLLSVCGDFYRYNHFFKMFLINKVKRLKNKKNIIHKTIKWLVNKGDNSQALIIALQTRSLKRINYLSKHIKNCNDYLILYKNQDKLLNYTDTLIRLKEQLVWASLMNGERTLFNKFHNSPHTNISPVEEFLAVCNEKESFLYSCPPFFHKHCTSFNTQQRNTYEKIFAAGVEYERCNPEKALELAQNAECCGHEEKFYKYFMTISILSISQDSAGKLKLPPKPETDCLPDLFNDCLRGFYTSQKLYNGDTNASEEWLHGRADLYEDVQLPKMYTYFVSARALMVKGDIKYAVILLKKLVEFARKYLRSYDLAEALSLQAVCYSQMSKHTDSLKIMIQAVEVAQQGGFSAPITLIGPDIVYLLENIMNIIKKSPAYAHINQKFVVNLLLLARKRYFYKGMFSRKKPNIKLSARQNEILILLNSNNSYQEMANRMGLKITTIREHVSKLYQKLKVNNSVDAIAKAKELKII